MGNPYEFRETMKAAFGFIDKTPEQVMAEHAQRQRDAAKPRSKRSAPTPPTTNATPRASEIEKMQALLADAKPRQPLTDE